MAKSYGDLSTNWAQLGADTLLAREPNINLKGKWEYEDGLTLNGLYAIYQLDPKPQYMAYIKQNIDQFVGDDAQIKGYNYDEFNLDHVNNGKAVLDLLAETGEQKYRDAADLLFSQLIHQPRLNDGTFWHKGIYPYQCWLDGLYMGSVFYTRYLNLFGEQPTGLFYETAELGTVEVGTFKDCQLQFINAYKNTVDADTGLCYHVYDEAKQQPWADKETGLSPHFWLRSIGWFVMAMVDTIEYLPEDAGTRQIQANLAKLLTALSQHTCEKTGLWYQIVDAGTRPLNYLESSGSLMITAALAKAIRLDYIDAKTFAPIRDKAWTNALEQFLSIKTRGHAIGEEVQWVNVNKICQMAGLGGNFPGRDGSYAYYMETPIVANDHKGYGPFLLVSAEMQALRKAEEK
ncbi:MAG: glycoside hydrolase family 88 protein [Lactobacillaceae bacterium]|jgi:unsaturated rhamnogalacturonyl hydrolase|nr:glycoside hydrolase family 88 protein [Lactobacillaceae bacterium]